MMHPSSHPQATRVLVTGAGGAAAVSVLNALSGGRYRLYAGDIDKHAAGLFLVAASRRMLLPRGDAPGFADALLEECVANGIDVLIPTVDTELLPLARHRAHFEERGVRVLVSPPRGLETCLDKARLMLFSESLVPTPRTAVLAADFDASGWTFPLIAKPRSGSGGRGVVEVGSEEALADLPRDGSYIVQARLPGEEYSVDLLGTEVGASIAVPRVRMKVDSGVAVCARTVRDEALSRHARTLVEALGLMGPINVQFRRDEQGTPRLLEINPRFPGTVPLTIAAGLDLPNLAVERLLGHAPALPQSFEEVAVVRTWQEHYVSVEALDRLSPRSEATSSAA